MSRKTAITLLLGAALLIPISVSFGEGDPESAADSATAGASQISCVDAGCVIVPGEDSAQSNVYTPAGACPDAAQFYRERGLDVDAFLGTCPSEEHLAATASVLVPADQSP